MLEGHYEQFLLATNSCDFTDLKVCTSLPTTYLGDAAWDQKACSELGYNFVLVGDRIQYDQSVIDLESTAKILSLIGL